MFRKMLVSLLLSLAFVGYSGMIKAETTKTALVTGANRGIGLELCRLLKERGEQVIGACRQSSPELEQLDRACRVSKRLTAIDWPVNCKGNVSTDPAKWCSVDTQEILEDLAKSEGKRKLEKEAGKLLEKLFK